MEEYLHFIITILVLGLLVTFHELGHFLVARYFGVKIDKFSIGFGPRIFSIKKGQTEYTISLIPLGGYVKMKGENPDFDEEDKSLIVDDSDSFSSKLWWQRALIAFAGPFFNIILAVMLFFISYSIGRTYNVFLPIIEKAEIPYEKFFQTGDKILTINGKEIIGWTDIYKNIKDKNENSFLITRKDANQSMSKKLEISIFINDKISFFNSLYPVTKNVIGEVSPGMPAWKAGLQENDKILKVNNISVNNWTEVRTEIQNSQTDYIDLLIERVIEGMPKLLEVKVKSISNPLEVNKQDKQASKMIGISQAMDVSYYQRNTIYESVKLSVYTSAAFIYMNYKALYSLAKNPSSFKDSIGGPVMVFSMTSQSSKRGFSELLMFVASISILLMIMNLLPIPILDGGHIIYCLIEGVFKKPIPPKIQIIAQQIGFLLLISLMLYAFYSDFDRLFQRTISKNKQVEEQSNINIKH